MKKALKTMAIKSRVYNTIRKELYGKKLDNITKEEKVIFFDNLHKLNLEAHWELIWLKDKRKRKAKIQALRNERGYKPKKKTTLEQYNQSRQKIAS